MLWDWIHWKCVYFDRLQSCSLGATTVGPLSKYANLITLFTYLQSRNLFSMSVIVKIGATVFCTTHPFTQSPKSYALYSAFQFAWHREKCPFLWGIYPHIMHVPLTHPTYKFQTASTPCLKTSHFWLVITLTHMSTLFETIYSVANSMVSLLADLPALTFLNVLTTGPVIYKTVLPLLLYIYWVQQGIWCHTARQTVCKTSCLWYWWHTIAMDY